MMPKAYRLNLDSMAVIMDNFASQLAEQYGDDVASEVLTRARNQVGMSSSMTGGSASGASTPLVHSTALDSTYNVGRRGTGYSSFNGSTYPLNAIGDTSEDGRRT